MHRASITQQGDTPAYAGLLHPDGSYSEVKVETNADDDFVVTLTQADGKQMVIHKTVAT
jgi:hypothetical protein